MAGQNIGNVYYSNSNGNTWSTVNDGLPNSNIRSLAISGSTVFAGTYGSGVYKSTDNGIHWTASNNGLNANGPMTVASNDPTLYAGNFRMYVSTNNGNSWTAINNRLVVNSYITSITISGTNMYPSTLPYYEINKTINFGEYLAIFHTHY